MSDLVVGTVLSGTYRVERLLGQGGMASVYLVSNVRLPCPSAVKVITAACGNDPEFVARFRREAEFLASLRHPHIVQVTDWNETQAGRSYLVMEYLQGEDLAALLARRGCLPVDEALSIFWQAASALQAAHTRGIVHRDLKPGNLFVLSDGAFPNYIKVLDFGIAKLVVDASAAFHTEPAVRMGTPAYMSPEQTVESRSVDARSDQFSLAVILYELLTGRRPFCRPGDSHDTIFHRIVTEEPAALFASADSPRLLRIEQAVRRALSKNPSLRFGSVAAFAQALASPSELSSEYSRTDLATLTLAAPDHQASGLAALGVDAVSSPWTRWGKSVPFALVAMGTVIVTALVLARLGKPDASSLITPAPKRGAPAADIAVTAPPAPSMTEAPSPPVRSPVPARMQVASISPRASAQRILEAVPPRTEKRKTGPRPATPATPHSVVPLAVPRIGIGGKHWPSVRVSAPASDVEGRAAIGGCFRELFKWLTDDELRSLMNAELFLEGASELRIKPHRALSPPNRNFVNNCIAREGQRRPLPKSAVVRLHPQGDQP